MKRLISLFLIIFNIAIVQAQHLNFLGIPMGSNINTFRKSLLAKRGFYADGSDGGNIFYFQGFFNGNKCAFSVCTTPKSKKVYEIYVTFSDFTCYDYSPESSKNLQFSMYRKYKTQLSSKYGNPFETTTEILLKASIWTLKYGEVYLIIDHQDQKKLRRLMVEYIDKASEQINEKESSSDW